MEKVFGKMGLAHSALRTIFDRIFWLYQKTGPGRVANMPRANRLRAGSREGGVYHVTHRCHNRAYLLKFKQDRDAYRARIREHVRPYDVSVLDYCITSNHVHLLLDVPGRLALSGFMREVASEFARAYNRRKHRSNSFWGDN